MEVELIDKYDAARILGLKNPDGLKHLEKNGTLRQELIKRPNSRVKKFVRVLVEDLAINLDDPFAHQRAIENFYASLKIPSNQSRKAARGAKAPSVKA